MTARVVIFIFKIGIFGMLFVALEMAPELPVLAVLLAYFLGIFFALLRMVEQDDLS